MLKPQDVLVMLKLVAVGDGKWSYAMLAGSLGMSASETHAAVKRSAAAGLFSEATGRPSARHLTEFVVHGVPYAYFTSPGVHTSRGVLTGFAAPPLDGPGGHPRQRWHVWPAVDGHDAGWSVDPLYRSAPFAARQDPRLYAFLALVDELRLGRARERSRAADVLASLISE